MSRVSRRQRAHEEQAGKRKLRNLFALLFLALSIGIGVLVILANWPQGETRVHVLIQKIQTSNYFEVNNQEIKTRRHAIPFQDSTCEQLHDLFRGFTNTEVAEIQPIQGSNEKVGLSDNALREIGENSISLNYVSGHLVLSEQPDAVVWIYPDQQSSEPATEAVKPRLENFASSAAKTKIVFLDAGQFSWSPSHPNRNQVPFQNRLSDEIKAIDPATNLWVFVSHSPNEISLNCTPEAISIFGLAIRETLASLESAISPPELFRGIYGRCAAYSTNFGGETLQHPMLFRAGVGLIEELNESEERIRFDRRLSELLDEEDEEKPRQSRSFPRSFVTVDEEAQLNLFDNWLNEYNEDHHLRPVVSSFTIENCTEPGQNLSELNTDVSRFKFEQLLTSESRKKHERVAEFRRNCNDLALQYRVAGNLLLWKSAQRNNIKQLFNRIENRFGWQLPVNYSDTQLNEDLAKPGDALNLWNSRYETLIEKLNDNKGGWLFANENFEKNLEDSIEGDDYLLTPLQAELMGVTTQRLLPYCKTSFVQVPVEETVDDKAVTRMVRQRAKPFKLQNERFQLNLDLPPASSLPPYKPGQASGTPWVDAYKIYQSVSGNRIEESPVSDCMRRIRLGVYGSEDMLEAPPANINIDLGDPKLELDFEDQLAIHKGHNFFRGRIKNSAGYFRIQANLTAGSSNGIEYHLFEKDRIFRESSDQAELETDSDFFFYVFARPSFKNHPDRYSFSFTASPMQAPQNAETLAKPVDLRFDDSAILSVQTIREFGEHKKRSADVDLMPWRNPSISAFSLPNQNHWTLKLHSLANLRSKFEFNVTNNSSITLENLDFKLFLLSDKFDYIQPDSIPRENLTDRLGTDTWNTVDFFSDPENYRLLGSVSGITIQALKSSRLKFSYPKPANEDKDAGKATAQDFVHLSAPLLLTVADQTTGMVPSQFQFVEIAPTPPFGQDDFDVDEAPFQIRDLLRNRNQFDDLEAFSEHMIPPTILDVFANPSVGANVLHVIRRMGNAPAASMGVDDAFANQKFNVSASADTQSTIGMIDVLGIPNYVTMKIEPDQKATRDSRIRSESRKGQFAGVQLVSDVWEAQQSGFMYNSELFGIRNDRKRRRKKIYLRRKADKQDVKRGDVLLNFSLPYGRENSPVLSRKDFSFSWNQSEPIPLDNPVSRSHFLATADFSFITAIKRHDYLAKNIVLDSVDIPLEIYVGTPDDVQDQIGNWSITTSNPNTDRSIKISPPTIEDIDARIRIDFSQVKPYFQSVMIRLDKSEKRSLTDLQRVVRDVGEQQFETKLRDLAAALEIDLQQLEREKRAAGGGMITLKLTVEVVDFFGQTLLSEATVRLFVSKPRPKSKPKPAAKKPATKEKKQES